jgi:hypothetical protein
VLVHLGAAHDPAGAHSGHVVLARRVGVGYVLAQPFNQPDMAMISGAWDCLICSANALTSVFVVRARTTLAICTAWPWWGIIPVAKSTSAVFCAPGAAGPALTAEWVDEVPWSTAGRRVYTETPPGASRTALMGMTRPR